MFHCRDHRTEANVGDLESVQAVDLQQQIAHVGGQRRWAQRSAKANAPDHLMVGGYVDDEGVVVPPIGERKAQRPSLEIWVLCGRPPVSICLAVAPV